MKKFTVAIVGLGARGSGTYAKYQQQHPDRMQITAIADIDPEKVRATGDTYNVQEEFRFKSAEELLEMPKLADIIFITTQDRQHKAHALAALEKGYHILLEKPIAVSAADCIQIRNKAQEKGLLVVVCHVLRYTYFYRKIKEALLSGVVGEPVSIAACESVGYWHQAHSFVRGNWNKSEVTTPMILQKCCHDFDILAWLLDKNCLSVSSYGSLKFFNEANAPDGSADRCVECGIKKDCPFDAEKIYLDNPLIGFKHGNTGWPCDVLCQSPTEEKLMAALRNGPYGRCVFNCDNDVVDHQVVNMLFDGGVTVSFTMSGFTEKCAREINIMCTKGQIKAEQDSNIITVQPFGKEAVKYDVNILAEDLSGHGGGDNSMLKEMFDALENNFAGVKSAIDKSVHGHLIAFAAEKSRLENGRVINITDTQN